jgi:hypothetical protein
METKNSNIGSGVRQTTAPQMQVRSNVRSGGDLETCMFNLNKWRDRYYYWYNQARRQGKI